MISIPEFKKLLGESAQGLSDKEIEEIRDAQRSMAEIVFEHWQNNRNENNETMLYIVL